MRRDVLVYLAGPMTARNGKTVEQHVADAVKAFMALISAGVPAFCPHLTSAYPSAWTVFDYNVWLSYDLAIIERCTHVLMLEGWRDSYGANREHDHAIEVGRKVCYSMDELQDALR